MSTGRLTLLVFTLAFAAYAQFGSPYPQQIPGQYPPGRYPPGQVPQGQTPNSGSGRGRQTGNNRNAVITVTTSGMLRTVAGTRFVLESDDHRIITYILGSSTRVQEDGKDVSIDGVQPGDRLMVDSTQDDQGYYTATAIRFDKAGTPADRAAAAQTWDLPKLGNSSRATSASAAAPQREPGDERPVLRRKNDDSKSDDTQATAQAPAPNAQAASAEPEAPLDTRPTTTMKPPDPSRDSDDPGPPSLRRGGPAPRPQQVASAAAAPSAPVVPAPPKPQAPAKPIAPASILSSNGSDDTVIAKARQVAASYAGLLPNFFCQQMTTRYESDHPKQGWDARDVVTADVAYEEGRESYKNIKVGNKPVNKSMEDIEGTRSTGEFSSLEQDLLSPGTGATFRRSGEETIHSRGTWVYKFEVPRERSHWRIEATAELYYPAYRGTVWIDKQTSRVLRIEQQGHTMPLLFPFDTIETATDYDYVRLADAEPFLLPVDAEVLTCVRGTSTCSRNRIEFRNYRKFSAESSVTFEEKQQ
jgi:hypothetical protein